MMSRSCSQCGNNGHNSRTCGESPGGGDHNCSTPTGIMLFGVRVTEGAASFRKSVSMNNLSQYEHHHEEPNADVAAGYESDDVVHASGRSRERKRGVPWTEEEHKLFLLGLQKVGKGDWRGISRNFVKTRTPTQVASHAQKYFLRRNNQNRRRRRSSLFDITTDTFMSDGSSMEEDQVHQETATFVLPQLQPQSRLNNNRPGGLPMSTFPVTLINPVTSSPLSGDNPMEKLTLGPTNLDKKSPKLIRPLPVIPITPSSKLADLNLNQKSPKDQLPALSLKLSTPSSEEQSTPASTHSSAFQAISRVISRNSKTSGKEKRMTCWNSATILAVLALLSSINALELDHTTANGGVGRRVLLSLKETPHGSNLTFDCSPSGPCVPCTYSEKSDEKYRCSETGYRIPFKCVEINLDTKNEKGKQHSQNGRSAVEVSDNANPHVMLQDTASNKGRTLLDDTSTANSGSQTYITYRSCISPNVERLSVLGFEGIILCLLIASGSFVYVRRKQTSMAARAGAGGGRIQMNRF
ncbi:unnamed protein product [Dovyalis caffra]|uniref:Uncharacterized protein n=1 Tax=Dovyalis caffra TaxID=77055 RepID=A0AAV1REX3_9ROSI|nr:unnamed protein product [Dovyalis caffra]